MAAKKHSRRNASDKTTKGRQIQDNTDRDVPAESLGQSEPSPTEAMDEASVPPAETTGLDTPIPAEVETIEPDPILLNPPTTVKKLSAVDAAAKVLGETGLAMTCAEMIAVMAAQGYWSSPKGRTPSGTLYSAVLREIQTRGDQARFRKTERGKFALRQNV